MILLHTCTHKKNKFSTCYIISMLLYSHKHLLDNSTFNLTLALLMALDYAWVHSGPGPNDLGIVWQGSIYHARIIQKVNSLLKYFSI